MAITRTDIAANSLSSSTTMNTDLNAVFGQSNTNETNIAANTASIATNTASIVTLLPGYKHNAQLTWNSATTVGFTADGLVVQTAGGTSKMLTSLSQTCTMAAYDGSLGKLDTGSPANSTWYSLWEVSKSDGTGEGLTFSVNKDAPTLTGFSGYTGGCYRRLGWVYEDGNGDIVYFTHDPGADEFLVYGDGGAGASTWFMTITKASIGTAYTDVDFGSVFTDDNGLTNAIVLAELQENGTGGGSLNVAPKGAGLTDYNKSAEVGSVETSGLASGRFSIQLDSDGIFQAAEQAAGTDITAVFSIVGWRDRF